MELSLICRYEIHKQVESWIQVFVNCLEKRSNPALNKNIVYQGL